MLARHVAGGRGRIEATPAAPAMLASARASIAAPSPQNTSMTSSRETSPSVPRGGDPRVPPRRRRPRHARPRPSRSSTTSRAEILAVTARASRPAVTPRGPRGGGPCGPCCHKLPCVPGGYDTGDALAGVVRGPVAGRDGARGVGHTLGRPRGARDLCDGAHHSAAPRRETPVRAERAPTPRRRSPTARRDRGSAPSPRAPARARPR